MTDKPIPAYLIAQLDVKDHKEYRERYGISVVEMLQKIGAEPLAAAAAPTVLEGEWKGNWTVVIRFPSMQAATDWYNSAEYQPLKNLRIGELTTGGSAVFVEGFDLSAWQAAIGTKG